MKTTIKKIDLSLYVNRDSQVLSGREFGNKVALQEEFTPEKINNYELVNIVIPHNIISILPSFGLGFLGKIIRTLDKDTFDKKITFSIKNEVNKDSLIQDIDWIIRRSLRI